MTVSFVIPVFKTERYLARCLDSLVAQTDGDFEAIVVDDCSPCDGELCAQKIVARYDARFRCVRHDRNRSTFQAKATGAKAATGEYVVPLDSDDYVRPRLVAELRRAAESEDLPDVIVYQMAKEFRGKVHPVKYNHPAGRCTGAEALEKLFAGRIFMPVCGKAIRREVFLVACEGMGVGPDFYLNFTDDLCWLIPILINAKTVSFIAYSGYRYWRHDDSMTKDVMAPERMRLLAEQSRRSVDAAVAYAERLGVDAWTVAKIRAQIYPTIRWLMRDMHGSRALVEDAYGAELVSETLRWDAASGGRVARTLRHLRTYGLSATLAEIVARLRGDEV